MTITEGRPMTYTAADGARIELAVAGLERIFTLTVSGVRVLTTQNEEYARTSARNEAQAHNARGAGEPIEVAQVESPLPAAERCASGLASGATLTMPTEPQARIMREATDDPCKGRVWRGKPGWGCADLRMLRALARRGWVELDHPIRPSYGTLTDAGRRALVRYEAKHGVFA